MRKLFKSKSGRFVDFTRSITVGNFFFFVVMTLILIFTISWFINAIFPSVSVVKVGTPFRFLIVGAGLTLAFYIVTRRQGGLDKTDIFSILLLGGIMIALFIYIPKLLPDVFSVLPSNIFVDNSFTVFYNVSQEVHQTIQSVIPIP